MIWLSIVVGLAAFVVAALTGIVAFHSAGVDTPEDRAMAVAGLMAAGVVAMLATGCAVLAIGVVLDILGDSTSVVGGTDS